ncbi:hypothetical protein thsps117_07680 [Pseudomonas sp. No.117]|jgi:uncharacterized protein YhhL (DUF1145 family)
MKTLSLTGKVLLLLFWLAAAATLALPLARPFPELLALVALALLLLHLGEVFASRRALRLRRHPWLDRLGLLIFGAFHRLPPQLPGA